MGTTTGVDTVRVKKTFEIVEVENGFMIIPGSRETRFMGSVVESYVAKTVEEVGSILKRLYNGKPVE